MPPPQARSGLTADAFNSLLARLDPDRDRAGELYETLRRKLLLFFSNRGASTPDELADVSMDRLTRKVAEGEEIHHISSYLFGVARLVLLESRKDAVRIVALADNAPAVAADEEDSRTESRRLCLEHCLNRLDDPTRALITDYYGGGSGVNKIEHRKAIAARLNVPLNALRIRTHRVRARLEECVFACEKE
jgi:DNA-directed RNA polymerase specialized sigma24 family protein